MPRGGHSVIYDVDTRLFWIFARSVYGLGMVWAYYEKTRCIVGPIHYPDAVVSTIVAGVRPYTTAALPEFDGDWDDTAGSYFDLTTDELTNSIREGKYRFRFKIPKIGRGTCYKLSWVERFTPEDGDPVDTEKSWTWDGTIPEGYDPDDSTTWPVSDEYTIAIPSENGTTLVGYYADPEDPETYVEGASGGTQQSIPLDLSPKNS